MADLNLIIANQGFVDEQEEDDVIIGAQGDGEEEAEGPGDGDGLIQPVGDQFLEGFPAFLQMFSSLPESQKKEAVRQVLEAWLHSLPDPPPKADDLDFANAMEGMESQDDCLPDGPSFYQSHGGCVMVVPEQTGPYLPPDHEYAEPPDVHRLAEMLFRLLSYCRWI